MQIRDRNPGGWDAPYLSDDISDHATKPFLLLQHNWFKMMEYSQNDLLSYYSDNARRQLRKVLFQYSASKEENKAALNFHLSQRERNDIINSIYTPRNQDAVAEVMKAMRER